MTTVIYKVSSPYYLTPQTSWFLSNYVDRPIPSDSTDEPIILESKYNLRPDLLSYDLYGTTDYMNSFMILNPDIIFDPIYDFVTGITIYVATGARLSSVLGS